MPNFDKYLQLQKNQAELRRCETELSNKVIAPGFGPDLCLNSLETICPYHEHYDRYITMSNFIVSFGGSCGEIVCQITILILGFCGYEHAIISNLNILIVG